MAKHNFELLGASDGAALDADGEGTIQQYLRGVLKAFLARIPALGAAAKAAAVPVTVATDDPLLLKVPDIAGQTFDATALVDQLALTTSADKSAQLSNGVYRLASDVDCYILQADTDAGTDLATYANGHFLAAGVEYIAVTGATNDYLAALVRAGSGVLTISGPF